MTYLRLKNLTKVFPGRTPVLQGLDIDIEQGERLVLLGPSGCGKTTTLRLIAGLEEPSDGIITIAGQIANRVPPWQRGVALVFQRPIFLPHLTIRTNLQRSLSAGAVSGDLDDCIEHLGLAHLLQRYPAELSGGEKQRVALARGLLQRQPILLLDEPLAHLDVPERQRFWRELALLHGRFANTIVYVTHDPAEAFALADRIAFLLDGVIHQLATPALFRSCPAHRFVAEVFQDPADPLNFFEGRLDSDGFHCPLGTWRFAETPRTAEAILGVPASQLRAIAGGGEASLPVLLVRKHQDFDLVFCGSNRMQVAAYSAAGTGLQPGQLVMIQRVGNTVHWFDRVTGRSLPLGPVA